MLELLKLQQASETVSRTSQCSDNSKEGISLKNVMQKLSQEKSDISLFSMLLERQARKVQIEEEQWTMQSLALLPVEIIEI